MIIFSGLKNKNQSFRILQTKNEIRALKWYNFFKKKRFKLLCPIIWTGLGSSLGNNISILMQTVNRCGLKLLKDLKTKDQALNFWLEMRENSEDSKQMGKHYNIIWL